MSSKIEKKLLNFLNEINLKNKHLLNILMSKINNEIHFYAMKAF